jgi:hypothetical protein
VTSRLAKRPGSRFIFAMLVRVGQAARIRLQTAIATTLEILFVHFTT